MKLYPDLWRPRLGYLLADAAALLWAILWVRVGLAIYHAVMTLSVIADGVMTAGRALNDAVAQVQQSVSGLPLIGSGLRDDLGALHGPPGALIATGHNALLAIEHLALLLGVAVAGIPLLALLLFYLPWRARKTRGFRNLDRMLRRPGARDIPDTLHVLAGRALYTLPYDRLLDYSPDPIAEWREGRYYNLARATMAEEGLSVQRYMRRNAAHQPPLPPGQPAAAGWQQPAGTQPGAGQPSDALTPPVTYPDPYAMPQHPDIPVQQQRNEDQSA